MKFILFRFAKYIDISMNKRILLINENPNFRQLFCKGIEEEGIIVEDLYVNFTQTYRKTWYQKTKNIFYLKVLGIKDYYQRKTAESREKALLEIVKSKTNYYDHILIFRADHFSTTILSELRNKTSSLITYQYDGMSICQKLVPNIHLFDDIYTFDYSDQQKYNFKGITNCWFKDEDKVLSIETDLFYVGVGVPERISKIKKIAKYCNHNMIKLNAHITIQPYLPESNIDGVKLSASALSYAENMRNLKKSNAVIDFKLDRHDGLSFRFFEALYYGKKIITNNATVLKYDFYHPNNILVTDYEDLSALSEFLALPYINLDSKIVEKYSVSNWVKNVFTINPHEKINLPTLL